MLDVAAIGELLIDFACIGRDEYDYPVLAAHPGGAPANFLAALAKYGAKTALLAKVGSDSFGKMLVATLDEAGVATGGVITANEYFTTLAFVTLDQNGEREFSFARKPGADTRLEYHEIDLNIIDEAKIFHFSSLPLTDEPSREATYGAVAYAKSKKKQITFDPNLRRPLWRSLDDAREQMLWGLSQADVVKISDEECSFLFGVSGAEAAEIIIRQYGADLVFVTCGANGCYYRNHQAAGFVDSLKGIRVVDTTGAGDIFFGAAIYKLLEMNKQPDQLDVDDLKEMTWFASRAAGISTTRPGGITSIPDLAEIANYSD